MSKILIEDLFAQKTADIGYIPVEYVLKFRDLGWLDQRAVRNSLIRHDYWALLKTRKLTRTQIVEKLAGMYDVNKRKIYEVIKMKPKRIFYCKRCGTEISNMESKRNNGVCDRCFAQSIII